MEGGIKLISDILTNASSNGAVPDIVKGFDTIFGGWFIMACLFATLMILGMGLYSWSGDFLASFVNSAFIVSVTALLLSLVKTSSGVHLLGYDKVTIFVVILVLLFIGKKIGE